MTQNETAPKDANEAHRERMKRRKEIQDKRTETMQKEKGLVLVHTGPGKGKTTAALGMVLRSLGHGYRVAIVQFIKGAWEPAEKNAFSHWGEQLVFHATGAGFTWETQDKEADIASAKKGLELAERYLADPEFKLVLLDEVNVAIRLGYLDVAKVIEAVDKRPPLTHAILTGRGAPAELIERADLVTEMTLIKHPFKEQKVLAQAGIEF